MGAFLPFRKALRRSFQEFLDDDCPTHAAALSYYTVFSLPPLILFVVSIAGSVFGNTAVRTRVLHQVQYLAGSTAAGQVEEMLAAVREASNLSGLAAVFGVATLVVASTTAFVELQSALNHAWNVMPDPSRSEILRLAVKRLISFGMILAIGFLTLVSLLLSALVAALPHFAAKLLPDGVSTALLQSIGTMTSLLVFAALFAAMYRYLPDAVVQWSDASLGGILTAILFTGGKYGIGVYIGNSNVTQIFGAAGSLAVILIWTYYSSMILLFGAEFTQVWSQRNGEVPRPERGAVREHPVLLSELAATQTETATSSKN